MKRASRTRLSGASLHAALAALVAACGTPGCGGRSTDPTGDTTDLAASDAGGSSTGSGSSSGGSGVTNGGGTTGRGGGLPYTPAKAACYGAGTPSMVAGWQPTIPIDYVALYEQIGFGELAPPIATDQQGTACSGATDGAACRAKLAALWPSIRFDKSLQQQVYYHFAYTRGDEVGAIGSEPELLDMLGSIDTANEAMVLLWAVKSRSVRCDQIFETPDGYFALSNFMLTICPISYQNVELLVYRDGQVTETAVGAPEPGGGCVGRRPDGLGMICHEDPYAEVGSYFAHIAGLELAAVVAFGRLERELAERGAPQELLERCVSARSEELRHTRVMSALAERFGGRVQAITIAPPARRSLLELALENAREGSVRELFGAAVAAWQAQHSTDVLVRSRLRQIARDEAEHAALSLDIEAWLGEGLSAHERRLVEQEKARALIELRAELDNQVAEDVQSIAGVPSPEQALRLLDALHRELMAA